MTNEKDNKPLLDTSPPRPRGQHGSIVRSLADGIEGAERRRYPGLSLSPLVISSPSPSPSTTLDGTVPPRPPRSPKRSRLADIAEYECRVEQKDTELESVVADFVKRLEAVPPPPTSYINSPESTYSPQDSIPPKDTPHKRTSSLPVIVEMLEIDRSRSVSGGTFGGGFEMGQRAQRGSEETAENSSTDTDTLPATPLLPTSGGHSPISPLALTNPPLPGIPSEGQASQSNTPIPPPLPSLHVTRPSTSSGIPERDPFAAVIDMMNQGDSPGKRRARGESPIPMEMVSEKKPAEKPSEGRAQTRRKGMMAPGALLAKVKSSQSLSKVKKQISKVSLRASSIVPSTTSTTANTTFLRPAPLPPPSSTYPARFAHTDYARSNASSPSPSLRFDGSLARASPDPRKSLNRPLTSGIVGDGEEMVEIPRFKRKELNLALVRRRGPWQRIGWVVLWLTWLVNGLAGLFFDVNLMYMLVQCTTHSTNGRDGPSRSWAFATAAYAICWGISIFIVWLGWEVYFEFWRKWRQTRPAIEPIYTSLPASLHLSLMSYSHFTFLVHVRLSSLSTPFRYDIIPETAHALVQMLPGILPLLPRAGIGIVLLTTFSSPNASRGDKDERFFSSSGGLSAYAEGVILAFVSVVGFRFLVFLIAAITLWISSTRSTRAFFSRPAHQGQTPSAPKKRSDRHKPSTPPRDPATTRSPQKTWYEAETSFGWDTWRSRMRARLQDAYELCMIRRSGIGIGSMVDGSFLVVGNGNGLIPSPRFNNTVKLGSRSVRDEGQGSVEELAENADNSGKAKALSENAVDDWLGTPKTGSTMMRLNQKRPENPIPPSDQSHSPPSTHDQATPTQLPKPVPMRTTSNLTVSGVYTTGSQASHSSHDIFYTPTQGNTPMFERTLPILGNGLRNMQDPSHGTLPARPESGVMGSSELLSDPNRLSQLSAGSDESITDDSAALLTASRRGSEATTTTTSGTPSRSNSTVSQNQASRRSSANRVVNAVNRSRAGSTASAGHVMTRARSSNITLLREGAGAVQGVVRRARSGTVDGGGYNPIDGETAPNTLPRRRSKLGLGPSVIDNRALSG